MIFSFVMKSYKIVLTLPLNQGRVGERTRADMSSHLATCDVLGESSNLPPAQYLMTNFIE